MLEALTTIATGCIDIGLGALALYLWRGMRKTYSQLGVTLLDISESLQKMHAEIGEINNKVTRKSSPRLREVRG